MSELSTIARSPHDLFIREFFDGTCHDRSRWTCGYIAGRRDGVAININEQSEEEHDPEYKRKSIIALKFDLLYKKPVPAPGLIPARAVLKKAEGRKRFVRATLEDGQGTILTETEAVFLEVKKRPRAAKI